MRVFKLVEKKGTKEKHWRIDINHISYCINIAFASNKFAMLFTKLNNICHRSKNTLSL